MSLSARDLAVYALTGGTTPVALLVIAGAVAASAVGGNLRPLVLVLVATATPVLSTLDLFDFELAAEPDRVRVRSGLLRIRDRWARRERIQVLRVSRPLLRAALGYETISVATADPTIRRDADLSLCAPLASTGTWPALAGELMEAPQLDEDDLRPVSSRAVRRRFVRFATVGIVPTLVGSALVAFAAGWRWSSAVLVIGGALLVTGSLRLARRAQRLDGFALDPTHLLVRRGVVSSQLWLVRRAKVQSVTVSATPFQRRLGLASLHVDTASVTGGMVVVPDLPRLEADAVAVDLVEHADRVLLPDGV